MVFLLYGILIISIICGITAFILEHSSQEKSSQNFIPDLTESEMKSYIERYMQSHEPKKILENNSCLIILDSIDDSENSLYIKVIDKKREKFFNIQGDKNILSTIYAIYQAFFNEDMTYKYICSWTLLRYSNYGEQIELSGDFV